MTVSMELERGKTWEARGDVRQEWHFGRVYIVFYAQLVQPGRNTTTDNRQ